MYRRGPGVVGMVSIFLLVAFVVGLIATYPVVTLAIVAFMVAQVVIVRAHRKTARHNP